MAVTAYIPNALTLLRLIAVPIALVCPSSWRFSLLLIASLSDFLDGFLARRWSVTSKVGSVIDPLADKLFVGVFTYLFWKEGALSFVEIALLFSRDLSLVLFILLSSLMGHWGRLQVRAFWCGKVATTMQFFIFAFLSLGMAPPFILFLCIAFFALVSLFELPFSQKLVRDN